MANYVLMRAEINWNKVSFGYPLAIQQAMLQGVKNCLKGVQNLDNERFTVTQRSKPDWQLNYRFFDYTEQWGKLFP